MLDFQNSFEAQISDCIMNFSMTFPCRVLCTTLGKELGSAGVSTVHRAFNIAPFRCHRLLRFLPASLGNEENWQL